MKVVDVHGCIDELRKENENLKNEIAWRKEETKRLKRTIGTGRIYSKLKEGLRDAEEHNEFLKKRIVELEAHVASRQDTYTFDASHLRKIIMRVLKAGNELLHEEGSGCLCNICAEWQHAKEELYRHNDSFYIENEVRVLPEMNEKVLMLKVSEI